MKNQVLKINGQNTLLHRSQRKIVWFSLPELKPIHKFYTKSNFMNVNADGNMIIADEGSIIFTTINLPPLSICEYQQQFLQYCPIDGFCLSHTLVLYEKHSITFFNRLPNLSKAYVIEVVQQILHVQASSEEKVIGVTVKQKNDTIYIWDLLQFSNKPKQEIMVADRIVKWQFYLHDMIVIMTSTHLRVYHPYDDSYRIQYYIEIPNNSIDFCMLDRPKTNNHAGRRSVYPVGILSNTGRFFIYQLFDIDKRIKNSVANLLTNFEVGESIRKVICGYEKGNKQLIFVLQNINQKPIVLKTDQKFNNKSKTFYLPAISNHIKDINYRQGYILVQEQPEVIPGQEDKYCWKIYKHYGRQQFELVTGFDNKLVILGSNRLYTFSANSLAYHRKSHEFRMEKQIQFKCPASLFILEEEDNFTYFVSGIKVFRLDIQQSQIKATGFIVRNQKFKLEKVCTYTRSLLYKVGNDYCLMDYTLENHKITAKSIKSGRNQMISLRNGRWAELSATSIVIGQQDRNLTTFDLMKFFKSISSQNNSLFQYKLYWTTHDGIILVVKNYLFVLQLTESSQGYSLNPIKKMLTYLHHRFSPDAEIVHLLDPRQFVVQQGNRVIRLGSKLGNFVSEDPFSLPDTILGRQLAMRKHYPPYHPKVIHYLIQLGSFTHISKFIKILSKWLQFGSSEVSELYSQLDYKFFQSYKQQEDERVFVSRSQQEELTQIELLRNLCEKILEDPYKLELEENGGLILQSQIQSLIFKDQNSRSMDFYSSIILTQFKTPFNKNKRFETMHAAYMLHSINKDEAISMLKPEKVQWSWFQKYSVVLWYNNKQQLKKWIEEIAGIQYRKSKQPFDCLLWYTITGKKNILSTLFKSNQFNSKQHTGVFNFLQKDLNDPKTKSAAIKNAYALHDKKRYQHSLAFFILGQQIQQAVNMCMNKLKDINLALLLCILLGYPTDTIYKEMFQIGDIWTKHLVYNYQGKHIDSFNCLFEDEDPKLTQKWEMQLKLTGYNPGVSTFAQMIQKSIPVKRELQEQKMKKMMKSHESTDIFDTFFGEQNSSNIAQEAIVEQKCLLPNYERLCKQSSKYFIQNRCPQLALMFDAQNYKAQRAYDLSRFMLIRKIQPTVLQIAQQLDDTISIISQRLHFNQTIIPNVQQHYNKTLKALMDIDLNHLIQAQKPVIGLAMHFCYISDQIIKKQTLSQQKQFSDYVDSHLKPIQLTGRLLICLQLRKLEMIEDIITAIISFYLKKHYQPVNQQFWSNIKSSYDQLPELKKNKTLKVLDPFEQSFYKYTFKRKKVQYASFESKLNIDEAQGIFIMRTILASILPIIPISHQLHQHMSGIVKKTENIIKQWVEKEIIFEINKQIDVIYTTGAISKLRIHYLNQFLGDNFQGICRAIQMIKSNSKNPQSFKVKNNFRKLLKQESKNGYEAIQIFKNKAESLQAFTINKNEGSGLEIGLLFKRNIKKLEVCQSLINRTRGNDGLYLIHEDTSYNIDHNLDFSNILNKHYSPIIQEALKNVIYNRNQYDGRGILRGSTNRWSSDYLKPLQPAPYFDFNDVNFIRCHHFLPVYMLGGKGQIDLCEFNQLKNYNRIKCPGMSDIIKLQSLQQRVTALDSSGNLSSYSFDHKIAGNSVFNIKKGGITDFCVLSPTIYGTCTPNSIQVFDSLIHPKRQCVFKLQTSQQPICIQSMRQTKLLVCRKSDIQVYDFRMDMQETVRDITGIVPSGISPSKQNLSHTKARCIASDHKNKILVGRQDGKIMVVDFNDKSKDYEVKCVRDQNMKDKDNKNNAIEGIEIMGNIAIARNSQGNLYLIDHIQ